MNGTRGGNIHDFEKPFLGYLGRTANLFDLSTSVSGNKLLCDRPHRDGSLLLRSQSDLSRMVSPCFEDQMVNKLIMSYGKANGTPMKMLINQEMSKEMESKHNSPNVVAKLMGLDTLPQNPVSAPNKYNLRGHYQAHDSEIPLRRQENGVSEKEVLSQMHQFSRLEECKDVNKIWKQSPKTNCGKQKSPLKEIYKDSIDEKKMALVRQKFMEAKHLATDEKLRQSKEFQDAIEVLSSNRDLFVKFLQDPTSLFSQNLCEFQSFPPSSETKCITVLRPSNMVDKHFAQSGNNSENQMRKLSKVGQPAFWDKNKMRYSPTCIVVLKPNHGKTRDVKTVASTPCFIPEVLHGSLDEGPEDDDVWKSRIATREITHQLRVNLMRHRRDEIALSSIYPDGYTGDDSSENEFAVGILSDSEATSPSPRLSWECMNKFCSPHSSPSFSRSSCSPEFSVCREAKKRLSERWALMASNGNSQEQRHLRRSSSTLGEMLALSETMKSIGSDHEKKNKEIEPRTLTSTSSSNIGAGDSPKFLDRSKSLPASSLQIGQTLNAEVLGSETGKTDDLKELTKGKSMKSSLRGKVSSFFSYRNKKSNKEKHNTSTVKDDFDSIAVKTPVTSVDCLERIGADAYCGKSSGLEACSSATLQGSTNSTLNLTSMKLMRGVISSEAGLSFTKPGNVIENQEQPSPISVLEPPIEEDVIASNESSVFMKSANQGILLPMKSNLIDKSPPIESIARTLNWDSLCSSPYPFKISSSCEGNEEEQQLLAFVRTVLSAAGLDGKLQRDSIFPRWHSLEYPLDPSLREKYAKGHDNEPLPEAKRRHLRSSRKLVFDCVNAALVDITIFESQTNESLSLLDCIWSRMKEWFSEAHFVLDDDGDGDSSVLETVVIKEVVGKGWVEEWRAESDNLIKEIEKKLLEALVEEAAADLIVLPNKSCPNQVELELIFPLTDDWKAPSCKARKYVKFILSSAPKVGRPNLASSKVGLDADLTATIVSMMFQSVR